MTFSIAALCPKSGMLGIAISSSSPAVAARCAHARAGVGVMASQNITDPALGRLGLDLVQRGSSPTEALAALVAERPHIAYRQLTLVDAKGRTAVFSGANTLGVNAVAEGSGVAAAGNLLARETVPHAMVDAFLSSGAGFAERLLAGLRAGLEDGGEAGPVHSAGLLIVDTVSWPVVDLRIDWDERAPLDALDRLWAIYKPQRDAYIDRALDPSAAPRFGVPGDE